MASSPSADFLRLRKYIAQQMRLSPIDQPLLLMELLGQRSPTSVSVQVRVGFACDQELNSWGWLCAT